MFDEFVKQARRLFSSKKNGGKQVPKLTDQLHTLKQVLLALAIVLVLGYSQFRDHFRCQAVSGVKAEDVTNFCLINGTSTVVDRAEEGGPSQFQLQPHVGQGYVTNDRDSMVVQHLYMRDLWLILILLAISSFIATRTWAQIFQNDVLQALLKLVGSEEGQLVKAAETARPYEMLTSSNTKKAVEQMIMIQDPEVPRSERLMKTIELVDNHANIYDHKLDYYPNQLIYLLLTKGAASYKMTDLKLRKQLLNYSICSTLFTLFQFVFPLILIGNQFAPYGLRWARAVFEHLSQNWLRQSEGGGSGSLDYELSAFIFPLSTQCEYKAFGLGGMMESQITQCTAAINEICSKIFPVIWWFVAINMIIEFCSFIWMAAASINPTTASWIISRRFWPGAREEADLIATFRHKRAQLQRERELLRANKSRGGKVVANSNLSSIELNLAGSGANKEGKSKQLEAEDLESGCSKPRRRHTSSYRRLINRLLNLLLMPNGSKRTERRRRRLERENQRDINIYHLLYLMHLRLGKSKSRTEEVIKMTASALETLLDDMDKANEAIRRQLQTGNANGRHGGGGHHGIKQLSIGPQQPIISNHDDTEGSGDELNGEFRSTSELVSESQSSKVSSSVMPNAPMA